MLGIALWYQEGRSVTSVLSAFETQVSAESTQVREDSQQQPQRYPDLILSLLRLYDQGEQYLDTFLQSLH